MGHLQPVLAVDPGVPSNSPRACTCRKGKSNTKDAEDKKKLLLTVAAGVAAITAIILGVKKAREVSSAVKGESVPAAGHHVGCSLNVGSPVVSPGSLAVAPL